MNHEKGDQLKAATALLAGVSAVGFVVFVGSASCAKGAPPEPVASSTARSETEPTAGDASRPAHEIWANKELHKPPPLDVQSDVKDFVTWAAGSVRTERDDVYDSLASASDKAGVVTGLIDEIEEHEETNHGRALVAMSLLGALRHANGTSYMAEYILRSLPTDGPLANGDFEVGGLSGWTTSGTTASSSTSHSGLVAGRLGATAATTGDSFVKQALDVPPGGGYLRFAYKVACSDTLAHDWFTVELLTSLGSLLATVVARECSSTASWKEVWYDLGAYAGSTVYLTFTNHDNGTTATYSLVDDVDVIPIPPSAGDGGSWHPAPKANYLLSLQLKAVYGLGFAQSSAGDAAVLNAVAL